MTKALVIKAFGDPKMTGPMVDGITKTVIELDTGELAVVKADLARLKAKTELRAYGDQKRFRMARREMAMKYSVRPARPAVQAILGVYGLVCLAINEAYTKLAEWNRS